MADRRSGFPAPLDRLRDAVARTYAVEEEIGHGAMATVFLARDRRHDRRVAIKLLRAEIAATLGTERFLREIRFVARLTHPHILPLLDSGEAGGLPYYVMPYVDGRSLRELLDRRRALPVDEAVAIAREVADGLHYAHAAGIVHRDIKPENILLHGGHAMIADFGIARAVDAAADDRTTTIGLTVGTPAYMSPEQAIGEERIDGRSDVYSLGVVLFELIAGVPPFTGQTSRATIARRFVEVPPPLGMVSADVPKHVETAVAAALALDPGGRPATAHELARALAGRGPIARAATDAASARDGAGQAPAHVTAAVPTGETELPSIAVLPFTSQTGDPADDFLCDGITEELIGTLGRLRTLRVAGRTSSFAFRERRQDIRAIGERLGVATVLDGSVRRAGKRVRVRAELVDARTGYQLWTEQIDHEMDDAFALQDEIAHAIANTLKATLLQGVTATTGTRVPGDAYEAYLHGRHALNKRTEGELRRAVGCFVAASREAPEFALALAGEAEAHFLLGTYGASAPGETMPAARAAAERALAIDPGLAEAYTVLGAVRSGFDWDWKGAEDAFRRAIALGPRHAAAHQRAAMNLFAPLGRFAEARAAIERARALDPLALAIQASAGVIHHLAGDLDAAIDQLRRAVALDPDFAMSHFFLAAAYRDRGDVVPALESVDRAIARSGGSAEMTAVRAQLLARRGDEPGARAGLDTLLAPTPDRYVSRALPRTARGGGRSWPTGGPPPARATPRSTRSSARPRSATRSSSIWRRAPCTRRCARSRGSARSCGGSGRAEQAVPGGANRATGAAAARGLLPHVFPLERQPRTRPAHGPPARPRPREPECSLGDAARDPPLRRCRDPGDHRAAAVARRHSPGGGRLREGGA